MDDVLDPVLQQFYLSSSSHSSSVLKVSINTFQKERNTWGTATPEVHLRYGYHRREITGSRLFTEVKRCWTGLISGWVTISVKYPVLYSLGSQAGVVDIIQGGRVGLVVRALAFHQCSPGSISALGVISGWSLLVLYSAMRGFSPGTSVFPSHQKPAFDFIWINLICK